MKLKRWYQKEVYDFFFTVKGYIDCDDVPQKDSGIYRIFPDGIPGGVLVYCDMKTTGEKWTVGDLIINSFSKNYFSK